MPDAIPDALPVCGQRTDRGPALFAMYRRLDPTGVSSTGLVAYVVRWPDGSATSRWITARPPVGYHRPVSQAETWDRLEEVMAVHGHHGSTVLMPVDDGPNTPHSLAFVVRRQVVAWGTEWPGGRCTTAAVLPEPYREITEWTSPDAPLMHRFRSCERLRWSS